MDLTFVIRDWAATGPGLHTQQQWKAWAHEPGPLVGDLPAPALSEVPAMLRRRISPLGRLAFQTAYWCQAAEPGMPVVWASRFGEVPRCLELLGDLNSGQPVSPTSFGLSVHNAVSAQYSIARGDQANHTALAAGRASAASAVIEALGLLHDGDHAEALIVHYDAPLPGVYADFDAADSPAYAWAWRVARPQADEPCLALRCQVGSFAEVPSNNTAGDTAAPPWPAGLDVLRFAIGDAPSFTQHAEGQLWAWSRHAAA